MEGPVVITVDGDSDLLAFLLVGVILGVWD